jgi:hypothetical protein
MVLDSQVKEEVLHLIRTGSSEKERERARARHVFQRHLIYSFQPGPLSISRTSQSSTTNWGPGAPCVTREPMEMFHIQMDFNRQGHWPLAAVAILSFWQRQLLSGCWGPWLLQ